MSPDSLVTSTRVPCMSSSSSMAWATPSSVSTSDTARALPMARACRFSEASLAENTMFWAIIKG